VEKANLMLMKTKMDQEILFLEDANSWPSEVLAHLDSSCDLLDAWYNSSNVFYAEASKMAKIYDELIYGLNDVIKNCSLHGYHCTRLTDDEIIEIRNNGMSLPNSELLGDRIKKLQEKAIIDDCIATRLIAKNQADDSNRANMIWFCFFKPHIASQSGIERFFRSWGGESLYNSHEQDPETGKALQTIGTPSIVEAKVPIQNIRTSDLSIKIAKQHAINKGIIPKERNEHEAYSNKHISAEYILRITSFPQKRFIELTGCNSWTPLL
jgi:hypothetical protein